MIDKIKKIVCEYYNVPLDRVMSRNRTKPLAKARQVISYLIKTNTDASLKDIAEVTNMTNHTSALYNIRTANFLYRQDIDSIIKKYNLNKEKYTFAKMERDLKIKKEEKLKVQEKDYVIFKNKSRNEFKKFYVTKVTRERIYLNNGFVFNLKGICINNTGSTIRIIE